MGTICNWLLIVVFITVLWICFCCIVNSITYRLFCVKVKLPKKKKFVGRLTPIYELSSDVSIFSSNVYEIRKWNIDWSENKTLTGLFYLFIPFLKFKFMKYGYTVNEYVVGIEDDSTVLDNNETLEKIYEESYNKDHADQLKYVEEENKLKSKINELNLLFNQNYTK